MADPAFHVTDNNSCLVNICDAVARDHISRRPRPASISTCWHVSHWGHRWSAKEVPRSYTFPVNRRTALTTVSVALEITYDANPKSIPSCDPSSGKTMRRPINIIIPYGSSQAS